MDKKVPISFAGTPELKDWIKLKAKSHGIDSSVYINNVMEKRFQRELEYISNVMPIVQDKLHTPDISDIPNTSEDE